MKAFLVIFTCLLAAAPAHCVRVHFNLLNPTSWVDYLSSTSSDIVGVDKWKKPEFCGDRECPEYHVEKSYDNYEIRTYKKGKWAVTMINDTKYELAYTKAAMRLTKYFKGGNENGTTMDLTTPTLALLLTDKEVKTTEKCYAFSMWLPEDYQEDTPRPMDAEVKIEEYEKATSYVRVFSGFATESTILQNARALHESLSSDEQDFDNKMVFVAVYDPPQKLFNRHNELHVPVPKKHSKDVQEDEMVTVS